MFIGAHRQRARDLTMLVPHIYLTSIGLLLLFYTLFQRVFGLNCVFFSFTSKCPSLY